MSSERFTVLTAKLYGKYVAKLLEEREVNSNIGARKRGKEERGKSPMFKLTFHFIPPNRFRLINRVVTVLTQQHSPIYS